MGPNATRLWIPNHGSSCRVNIQVWVAGYEACQILLGLGVITNNEPSPVIALRPMDRPISAWMTLGAVHTMNGVGFTLDDAIGTEPWEAITLSLDS